MAKDFKPFTPAEREMIRKCYAVLGEPYGTPYDVCPHDWAPYMSPIEENVWHDIRCNIPQAFLWQYPCRSFFIDFASPKLKVALEVDGRDYHTNYRKDWLRDQYLLSHGYERVYHIPGFISFQEPYPELADDDETSPSDSDAVLLVTADGGEAENNPGIINPYQGSAFVEYITYRELISYLSSRAFAALDNEHKAEGPREVRASDYLDEARAYRKTAAEACFCGKSWWLEKPKGVE